MTTDTPDDLREALADRLRAWSESCPDPDYFTGDVLSGVLLDCGEASEAIKALMAENAALRESGGERMREEVNLTGSEAEFIAEMRIESRITEEPWCNFDPDFRQKDIERLIRKGWFEKRMLGGYRQYRWTPAGRAALAQAGRAETDRAEMKERGDG